MKVITDPIHGIVDISPVLGVVDTEEFQALSGRYQLGLSHLVFRSATHTRFAHSIGAYHNTRVLVNRLLLEGVINKEEGDALAVFALCHDIGHGPLSHVIEDFAPDHKVRTAELIGGKLRNAIEHCGVNANLVKKMALHDHPLASLVYDKSIGTEKLDYLERDSHFTTLCRPAGLEYLRNYVYYVDGQVAIDEKVVESALDIMNFYMKMYKEVYFRKSLVIAQRMFHKIIHLLSVMRGPSLRTLSDMTDAELLGLICASRSSVIGNLYARFRARKFFKEAIAIRALKFVDETRIADKSIRVFGVSVTEMNHVTSCSTLQKRNHQSLANLEVAIANMLEMPPDTILVVPVFNPERFEAHDVSIYGSDKKLHSLRARRPAHFASMEETAESYNVFRVCTFDEYREKLCSGINAEKVRDLVLYW